MVSEEEVAQWDSQDPLAKYRSQFVIDDPEVCYMVGNSLGRLPKATISAIEGFLNDEWGKQVVSGWQSWVNEPQLTGDLIGQVALGAAPDQVIAADNTSVNFYQLCSAAIKASPGRRRVITDSANFPTDRYVLEGICAAANLELILIDDELGEQYITPESLAPYLNSDTALVTFSVVQYRSGALHDVQAITKQAHSFGAKVVWDASHAVGVVPLSFDEHDVDAAVGCTYKYTNSGPGAPAWLYVNKRCQTDWRVPIQGWFAQEDMFAMGPDFKRAQGMPGYRIASPSLLGLRCIQQSFALIADAGIHNIYAKANKGTELMLQLFDAWLAPLGFGTTTPRDPLKRGGHITLTHPNASHMIAKLHEAKVVADFRKPNSIRVAVSPLVTSYGEVYESFSRIRDVASQSQ